MEGYETQTYTKKQSGISPEQIWDKIPFLVPTSHFVLSTSNKKLAVQSVYHTELPASYSPLQCFICNLRYLKILLSGKSFSDDKNKAEPSERWM